MHTCRCNGARTASYSVSSDVHHLQLTFFCFRYSLRLRGYLGRHSQCVVRENVHVAVLGISAARRLILLGSELVRNVAGPSRGVIVKCSGITGGYASALCCSAAETGVRRHLYAAQCFRSTAVGCGSAVGSHKLSTLFRMRHSR